MRGLMMSLLTASALLAFGVSDASAFSCKRHFVNKSQCAWKVAAKSQHGNVYFTYANCTQAVPPTIQPMPGRTKAAATKAVIGGKCNPAWSGTCVVPVHCTIQMEFTYTAGRTTGNLEITDGGGKMKSFFYDTTKGLNQCPYIAHSGSTGGASVNDPANGDVASGQCNW